MTKQESNPGSEPEIAIPTLELNASNLITIWRSASKRIGGMASDMAAKYQNLELRDGEKIVVTFDERHVCDFFQRSDRPKILEAALNQITGCKPRIEFRLLESAPTLSAARAPKMTRVQMIRQLEKHELIKSAIEVFDAEVVEFRDPGGGNGQ